ncbi:hypothetical protein F5B18DRAFT_454285 [Nemania serpens]|nr:hypothetical protein F5B18DRAFT_454285 [Nemania serpens]
MRSTALLLVPVPVPPRHDAGPPNLRLHTYVHKDEAIDDQGGSRSATAAPNVTAVPIGTSYSSFPELEGMDAGPFITAADSISRAVDDIGLDAAYFANRIHRYKYVSLAHSTER